MILYSNVATIHSHMNIYNSVLLGENGIIQQVRTTFLSSRSALFPVDKYITLYTFSMYMEGKFTEGFVPYRFDVDDAEPGDEKHSTLQEVILAGSDFIHRRKQWYHPCYAELVIVFANKDTCNMNEIRDILHGVLNYYNNQCNWPNWKAFAWRRVDVQDALAVAVSLEN